MSGFDEKPTDEECAYLFKRLNPNKEPVGDHTGRCRHCGSMDLWSDNLHYGCNVCGRYLGG